MTKKKKVTSTIEMLDDDTICALAAISGLPKGWYMGPWFDVKGELRDGLPPCMRNFVISILACAMAYDRHQSKNRQEKNHENR